MSASAGPSLQGIGRGGDSNLVLEMDAHDAKSYPGEPTSNIFYNPNNWTGADWTASSGTIANNAAEGPNGGSAGSITAVNADPYIYSGAVHSVATGSLTFSCWVKGVGSSVGKSGDMRINFGPGTATGSDPSYVQYTLTDQWQRVSILATVTGAGTIQVGLEPPNSAAVGDVVYLADAQLEQKGYATPFVREGKGGTGTYNARPASVNLMIHGDVGTGQTFSDSSPSKHTITTVGNTTHSSAQSKFSGGSIYFDGNGDYLSLPASTDFDLGTGAFTVDVWVNFTSLAAGWETIYGSDFSTGLAIYQQNNGSGVNKIYVYLPGTDGSSVWSPVVDTWYHIAVVRVSGGTITTYVNGVALWSFVNAGNIQPSGTPYIGAQLNSGPSNNFYGYMDEFRITKGTALWASAFTPPTRRNLSAPVVDRSGNDNGGNFATTDPTDVVTYRVGEVIRPIANAYWNFDGTDDSISLGGTTVAASDRPLNAYPFTFTAWVISDTGWSPASGQDELLNMNIAGQRVSLGAVVNAGWVTGPSIMYGGSAHWSCAASAFGNPTGWTHIAYVIYGSNNSNHKIYINGVSQTLTNNGGAHGGTAGWTLGSNSVSAEYWFGNIANAQLYNKALSETEIVENFNQQNSRFNVPNWGNRDIVKNGLKVWLDAGISESYSGSGTTWYDISGNNYDAALSGPAWDSNGYFVFDGSTDKAEIVSFPYTNFSTSGGGTIEIWYKMRGTAHNGMLIDCCDPAGGSSPYNERDYFSIRTNWSGGNTAAYFKNNSDSFSDLSFTSAASGAAAVSNWVYIAYTVDINAVTTKAIYEYGVQVNSTTASIGSWNTTLSQILIGRDVLPAGDEVHANIAVVPIV